MYVSQKFQSAFIGLYVHFLVIPAYLCVLKFYGDRENEYKFIHWCISIFVLVVKGSFKFYLKFFKQVQEIGLDTKHYCLSCLARSIR